MKIFEIANVRNIRGNDCPVIKHVITRVNPEKTKKQGVKFSRISSYELGQRADLCSAHGADLPRVRVATKNTRIRCPSKSCLKIRTISFDFANGDICMPRTSGAKQLGVVISRPISVRVFGFFRHVWRFEKVLQVMRGIE